jgi:hypothetical protein
MSNTNIVNIISKKPSFPSLISNVVSMIRIKEAKAIGRAEQNSSKLPALGRSVSHTVLNDTPKKEINNNASIRKAKNISTSPSVGELSAKVNLQITDHSMLLKSPNEKHQTISNASELTNQKAVTKDGDTTIRAKQKKKNTVKRSKSIEFINLQPNHIISEIKLQAASSERIELSTKKITTRTDKSKFKRNNSTSSNHLSRTTEIAPTRKEEIASIERHSATLFQNS